MKKIKKTSAVVLAVLMMISILSTASFAAENSKKVNFLCYNVAGLPDFKALLGKEGAKDVPGNQAQLGNIFNESNYDVIAVQEDFGYHNDLISPMTEYKYKTKSSGSIPGGDGLNVFTKNNAIYDASRVEWVTSFGPLKEGDTLTPKGILYTVLDMGDGIFIDFYVIHADAFDGDGSALARAAQYRQLADLINKNSANRPVIVTGDFNTSLHIKNQGDNGADEKAMYEIFTEELGMKDAWTELKNGGNYEDFSAFGGSYWGRWDSVEKYYYKDGAGISVTPESFEYVTFVNSDGVNISDHNAAACTFSFEKTSDFVEDTRSHSVYEPSDISILFNRIRWFIKDLILVFNSLDELKELL